MTAVETFRAPMSPWSDLEGYACRVGLPGSQLNLHVYSAGEPGPDAFLLVHGLGDEADTWRALLPALAEKAYVLAPDLPGFGRSDQPRGEGSVAFYKQVLLELVQALQVDHATLVGHSMGGVIAHAFALAYPDRVKRLVLISGSLVASAVKINLGTLLFILPGIGEWMYNRLRRDPQAAYRSLQPYYRDLESLPQAEQEFLYTRVNQRVWSDGQREAFLSALRSLARWLPAQQKQLPSRLADFNIPTTVLWGEDDRISAIANGYALVELQPSASLVTVPAAGHNLHQENPQAVLEALLQP